MIKATTVRGVIEALPEEAFAVEDWSLHAGESTERHPTRCRFRLRESSSRLFDVEARDAALARVDDELELSGVWGEIATDPRAAPFLAKAPGPHVPVKLRVARLAIGDEVVVTGRLEQRPSDFRSMDEWLVATKIARPTPEEPKRTTEREPAPPTDPVTRVVRRRRAWTRGLALALACCALVALFVGLRLPHVAAWAGASVFALLATIAWLEGERAPSGTMLPVFAGADLPATQARSDYTPFGRAVLAVFLVIPLLFVAEGLYAASSAGTFSQRGRTKGGTPGATAAGRVLALGAVSHGLGAAFALLVAWSEQPSRRRLRVLLDGATAEPQPGAFTVVSGRIGDAPGPGWSTTSLGPKSRATIPSSASIADGRYWVIADGGTQIRVSEGAAFASTFVTRADLSPTSYRLVFQSPPGARVRLAAHVTAGEGRLEANVRGPESVLLLCHRDDELPALVRAMTRMTAWRVVGVLGAVLAAGLLVLAIV